MSSFLSFFFLGGGGGGGGGERRGSLKKNPVCLFIIINLNAFDVALMLFLRE